jgi:hypothetical protein
MPPYFPDKSEDLKEDDDEIILAIDPVVCIASSKLTPLFQTAFKVFKSFPRRISPSAADRIDQHPMHIMGIGALRPTNTWETTALSTARLSWLRQIDDNQFVMLSFKL